MPCACLRCCHIPKAQKELASLVQSQRTGAQVEAEARARFKSEEHESSQEPEQQQEQQPSSRAEVLRSQHAMAAARVSYTLPPLLLLLLLLPTHTCAHMPHYQSHSLVTVIDHGWLVTGSHDRSLGGSD